mmetsp:Transcript_58581/g.191029  ORF Transcript_58581/g.191029 Transcript_58581/m.191029 type:complete len:208 (-) Transcript_58581:472-1095(-)
MHGWNALYILTIGSLSMLKVEYFTRQKPVMTYASAEKTNAAENMRSGDTAKRLDNTFVGRSARVQADPLKSSILWKVPSSEIVMDSDAPAAKSDMARTRRIISSIGVVGVPPNFQVMCHRCTNQNATVTPAMIQALPCRSGHVQFGRPLATTSANTATMLRTPGSSKATAARGDFGNMTTRTATRVVKGKILQATSMPSFGSSCLRR